MRWLFAVVMLLAVLAPPAAAAGLDEAVGQYQRGNYAEAGKRLKPFAEQGNPLAQLILGELLLQGRGVPQNRVEAAKWLRKSADQGLGEAQVALGRLYLDGTGVGRDDRQAAAWFRKAAEQNDADGQISLGTCYATGKGTEKDLVKAHMWLSLGTAQPKGSARADALRLRDSIAKRLSAAQLAQAREMAQKWKPGSAGSKAATSAPAPVPGPAPAKPTPDLLSVGSGFFVSGQGHVLTTLRLVESCRQVGVRQGGNALRPASIAARDQANDLAVIKAEIRPRAVLAFHAGEPVRAGDSVVALGYAAGDRLGRAVNAAAGTVHALAGIRDDPRHLLISLPAQPGSGGGPVVDLAGLVVAVVPSSPAGTGAPAAAPAQTNLVALKADLAEQLLAANRVPFQKATAARTLPPAAVAAGVGAAVVLVECRN